MPPKVQVKKVIKSGKGKYWQGSAKRVGSRKIGAPEIAFFASFKPAINGVYSLSTQSRGRGDAKQVRLKRS